MSYTKLFSHIVTSTIWREPKEVKILWITMLALSNKHGEVMASIPGLADMARLTVKETEVALVILEGPDSYSRTPDHDGRRLFKIDGGWHVLNYTKHRRMASVDEQREMAAARQRRWYQKHKKPNAVITDNHGPMTVNNGTLTHECDNAEADTEVHMLPSEEIESPERKNQNARSARGCAEFEEFWALLPRENRIAKGRTRESWTKAIRNGATVEQIINGVASYARYEKKRKHQGDYKPLHPSTWLNQGRFEDDEVVENHSNGDNDDSWMRSVYG